MLENGDDSVLREIIAFATGRDVTALRRDDNLKRILGLDAIDLIRIAVMAEAIYGVECEAEQLYRINRYGDLVAVLGVGAEHKRSAA